MSRKDRPDITEADCCERILINYIPFLLAIC